jgi:rhodanese-related sulfurtransferase
MAPTLQELVKNARKQITEVSPEEAQQRIENGAVALDVREAEELAEGHIPDAAHIPRGFLEFKAGDHEALQSKDTPICVYCKAGGRSALATQALEQLGYTNVVSIDSGFEGWKKAGLPLHVPGADEEE